jgi:hypothetical protein
LEVFWPDIWSPVRGVTLKGYAISAQIVVQQPGLPEMPVTT